MARASWFDERSNELSFSKYVEKMDSWQQALADGVVQPEELSRQQERVTDLLRKLEPTLSDEQHKALTEIFYELAVLYGMQRMIEFAELEKGEE